MGHPQADARARAQGAVDERFNLGPVPDARLAAALEAARAALGAVPATLARRGRTYRRRVGAVSSDDPDLDFLSVRVQGSRRSPYEVSIELFAPNARGGTRPEVVCTCPYSAGSSACKHTWAALAELTQALAAEQALRVGPQPKRSRAPKSAAREEASLEDPVPSEVAYRAEVRRAAIVAKQARLQQAQNAWQGGLKSLDAFLGEAQGRPVASHEPPSVRVVWRVSVTDGFAYVEAYEQRPKGGGSYSKGRKVTPQRLAQSDELWTHPEVEAVAATVVERESTRYYGRFREVSVEFDHERALLALVGSPHVVWRDRIERPVEVRRGQLGFTLVPLPGGALDLTPTFGGEVLDTRRRLVLPESGVLVTADRERDTITVGRASQAAVRLVSALLANPGSRVFPPAGQAELLARLERLEGVLPVEIPDALEGEPQPADARLRILLRPTTGGLAVRLGYRPSGAAGPLLTPGEGAGDLSGWSEGKRTTLRRDLVRERAHAEEVGARLGRPLGIGPGEAWAWEVLGEDALDLVAALQAEDPEACVPEWPEGAALSVSREIEPTDLRVSVHDRKDWFGLEGGIDVDGWKVSLAALLALKPGERYLALDKGRWLRVSQQLRERLESVRDVSHGRARLEFDATSAPILAELLGDARGASLSKGWKELVARLQKAKRVSTAPPKALKADLRPYQREGYAWLKRLATWGVGACLADDMGLGKTVQAIALLLSRSRSGPALVVAPTSVGSNWMREVERFAPRLRPILYRETDRSSVLEELRGGDLVVISYDLARIDRAKLAEVEWGTLVFDEAQQVKNAASKTARALHSLPGGWRLALTGTPVENHLGELWSLFRLISPGLFGSWETFKQRFALPIERDKDDERRAALARVIQPFVLRRTKDEVLTDLPPRADVLVGVDLSARERKAYEAARAEAIAELLGEEAGGQDKRFQVLAALTRLRQLACHPALVDPAWQGSSAKLDALSELLENLRAGGHRALVFSQFTRHLGLARELLERAGVAFLYLDGKTLARQRQRLVDQFQAGEGEVFLISLKAGGKGLNLTGADYVVHLDPWWNPAVEDQATDRAHRIGQTKPVTVYRLVAQETIEEQILELHASKRDLVAGILDGTDRAGKLSTDELIGLIQSGRSGGQSGR